MLHVALPIYAALDWIFFGDRTLVPWKKFWVVLVYPLVWIAVVLIRGSTDGWVPYPFLDPALGYGVVALYCVGISVAVAVVGGAVWGLSRVRILKP
ncbi:MAG: Pr6Pr family membrane protein [Lacisediminihabitans sp.]